MGDRANNVFLARSYVFSFVAFGSGSLWAADPGYSGGGGSGSGSGSGGCLPINLLLLTTTTFSDEM